MTKPYLLDVNVLIALSWPSHVHYEAAQEWFARKHRAGFATCPLTQLGFVRISSNPRYIDEAVSPGEAVQMLDQITRLAGHHFWPDKLGAKAALAKVRGHVVGHRQVTDAYLIGLAEAHGGTLATLDRGAASLSPSVELVGASR